MWNRLTVGKLKNFLNDVPDESGIYFWIEKNNDEKEEAVLNSVSISYFSGDDYREPIVTFIVEE